MELKAKRDKGSVLNDLLSFGSPLGKGGVRAHLLHREGVGEEALHVDQGRFKIKVVL
jgi:hypothetical protein